VSCGDTRAHASLGVNHVLFMRFACVWFNGLCQGVASLDTPAASMLSSCYLHSSSRAWTLEMRICNVMAGTKQTCIKVVRCKQAPGVGVHAAPQGPAA
jgi:hypothetical protein